MPKLTKHDFRCRSGELVEEWYELDGVRHGPFVKWFRSGAFYERGSFLNGLKDGVWYTFRASGELNEETHYKQGHRYGPRIVYCPNGFVSAYMERHPVGPGKLDTVNHGPYRHYYENGNVQIQYNNHFQRRHGEEHEYHKNGRLKCVCFSHDGRVYGEVPEFNEYGTLVERKFLYKHKEIEDFPFLPKKPKSLTVASRNRFHTLEV